MKAIRSFRPKYFKRDTRQTQPSAPTVRSGEGLKIIPLGGIGDVTKNMYVYEYENDIVVIDCGVGFPEDGMLGIDLVIPDVSYLKENKHKIRGIVISHGHDDHLGGLPFIWPELRVPIYSQRLSCGFIKARFAEHKLPKDQIHELKINDTLELGAFRFQFYPISHSVPDSTGIIIRTPVGTMIHQADFKIDWTPVIGSPPDLATVAKVSQEGVLMMAIDCLRVEKPGYNQSERIIEKAFAEVEARCKGKLLITLTSSNISRIQQAISVAFNSGRKIAFSGRSLETAFQVARDLDYLDVPPGLVIPQEELHRFPDEKLLIVIAGAQGQPDSSLARAAHGDHKFIHLRPEDCIIFSADPIPTLESAQDALIDTLNKIGCRVHYSAVESDLHVSGHAVREELKLMIELVKAKYLLPIGGTYTHMKAFSMLAQELNYREDQVILPDNGDVVQIKDGRAGIVGKVEAANVYIDGLGVGDIGQIVLRDRQTMAEEGIVVIVVPINKNTRKLSGPPDIISRGFVYEKESGELIEDGERIVKEIILEHENKEGTLDWRYISHHIENDLERFFYQKTNRRPLILPIVVEL